MDQTLLKYWKTCLQDAERKAIALKGPRITLNIGDKILKFIPLKSIPVIFPDWKAEDSNEKQKVMIAPCILLPEFENGLDFPIRKTGISLLDYCHHVA